MQSLLLLESIPIDSQSTQALGGVVLGKSQAPLFASAGSLAQRRFIS